MNGCLDKWAESGEVEERLLPPTAGRLLPYLAALASAGIPHRAEPSGGGGWHIAVPDRWADAARRELVEYEEANRDWRGWSRRGGALRPASSGAFLGTAAAVAGLLAFFIRMGPAARGNRFFDVGAMDTDQVLAGAWWRTITSLTLHADSAHVMSNAICAAVFGFALCQLIGVGPAWCLVLASGILGNVSEVLCAGGGRTAVGASTATFGALGALGVLQTLRYRRHWPGLRTVFSRTWIPIGAAAALLAWLGASPRADVLGHAFGFGWGMVLGGMCSPLMSRDIEWYWHALLGLVSAGTFAAGWHLALA